LTELDVPGVLADLFNFPLPEVIGCKMF
jgi:hypothetical protein